MSTALMLIVGVLLFALNGTQASTKVVAAVNDNGCASQLTLSTTAEYEESYSYAFNRVRICNDNSGEKE